MRRAEVVRTQSGPVIEIPQRLCMLLGFEAGYRAHLHFIESQYYDVKNTKKCQYNLWVTSFDPLKAGGKVWDLEFTLGDRKGCYARAIALLRDLGVWLEVGESRTLIVNVKAEGSVAATFKANGGIRSVEDLNDRIAEAVKADGMLRGAIRPVLYELRLVPNIDSTWRAPHGLAGKYPCDLIRGAEEQMAHYIRPRGYQLKWYVRKGALVTRFPRFNGSVRTMHDLKEKAESRIEKACWKSVRAHIDEVWVDGRESQVSTLCERIKYPGDHERRIKGGEDNPIDLPEEQAHQELSGDKERVLLRIPDTVTRTLDRDFKRRGFLPKRASIANGKGVALLVADSDIPALRVSFPPPNARVVKVTFRMADCLGSLSACASFVTRQGLNLLETQLGLVSSRETSEWKIIARVERPVLAKLNQKRLMDVLRRGLALMPSDLHLNMVEDEFAIFEDAGLVKRTYGGLREKERPLGETGRHTGRTYDTLYAFESIIRDFIGKMLVGAYGDEWWEKGVPSMIRERAEAKFAREQKSPLVPVGSTPVELLDFGDYLEIVVGGDNYRKVFSRVFPDKDSIASKLRELAQVRNQVMHSRPCAKHMLDRVELYTRDIIELINKGAVAIHDAELLKPGAGAGPVLDAGRFRKAIQQARRSPGTTVDDAIVDIAVKGISHVIVLPTRDG